ncbi:hypothetical protein OG746_24725 [Streptomyces sp. NBC_01016]|uniref:hypothetical protein n=1 Tax=Streptomyces sp. NBC_01016 TaxID=2903720 RepID=UPI00225C3327|nr:hypothetical protein [Streptomyces sp. NBC_01016]MCX4831948.1 hypothetical protein [Streptomyces sp. NBC_01016]
MSVGRYRDIDVSNLPPGLVVVLGVLLLVFIAVLVWGFQLMGRDARIKDPEARARARRRKESHKRQKALRARREKLRRKAARGG